MTSVQTRARGRVPRYIYASGALVRSLSSHFTLPPPITTTIMPFVGFYPSYRYRYGYPVYPYGVGMGMPLIHPPLVAPTPAAIPVPVPSPMPVPVGMGMGMGYPASAPVAYGGVPPPMTNVHVSPPSRSFYSPSHTPLILADRGSQTPVPSATIMPIPATPPAPVTENHTHHHHHAPTPSPNPQSPPLTAPLHRSVWRHRRPSSPGSRSGSRVSIKIRPRPTSGLLAPPSPATPGSRPRRLSHSGALSVSNAGSAPSSAKTIVPIVTRDQPAPNWNMR